MRQHVKVSGKQVGDNIYLHVSAMSGFPDADQLRIADATAIANLKAGEHFNVVKLNLVGDELSFLNYPTFFDDPFPALAQSWRISISRKSVILRNYKESQNPPILHRKELLLVPEDPRFLKFAAITAEAESLGLFEEPNRIGFRDHWFRLIAERGYELVGETFVPLANASAFEADSNLNPDKSVQQHRTALSRQNFSAPVQALARHQLLRPGATFFDYGCGRGDDVRGLVAADVDATGWDAHFAADSQKRVAFIPFGGDGRLARHFRQRLQRMETLAN